MSSPNFAQSQKPIEEVYEVQLAFIETTVVKFFREHPDLTDAAADEVYEELAKRYRAEATAHEYKQGKLDGLRAELHAALLPETEALVGRGQNQIDGRFLMVLQDENGPVQPVSAEEMRMLMLRLRKSIKTFRSLGRQAYLKVIDKHILI